MKRRENCYNPKRQIAAHKTWESTGGHPKATVARYKGNPQHKKYPGDYNLTPPSSPRPGKTLCDAENSISMAEAQALLMDGFRRNMVSVQSRDGWPQNVWSVNEAREVFEAQLENRTAGDYHGYPMPMGDRFRRKVLEEWEQREP